MKKLMVLLLVLFAISVFSVATSAGGPITTTSCSDPAGAGCK